MARSVFALAILLSLSLPASTVAGLPSGSPGKLDASLRAQARGSGRMVRVIVQTSDVAAVERLVQASGGRAGRRLKGIDAVVGEVPAAALDELSQSPLVTAISADRP